MSIYWNKVFLDKFFSITTKNMVKYKVNSEIGRIYLYLEKEENQKISGKLIFYPKELEVSYILSDNKIS